MALVQAPALLHRQPQPVHLLEREPQRADGALEHRGVGEVEVEALGREQPAGGARLLEAGLRDRSTSVQPVKRFSRFQTDSPWRRKHDAVHALNYNVALPMDFIQNNLLLIAVAFASGAMLIWPFVRRTAGGPWVNTLQATQLINREDALVLDVREPAEYAKGHILGAKNVPLGGPRAARGRARQAQGEAGDRASARAAAAPRAPSAC